MPAKSDLYLAWSLLPPCERYEDSYRLEDLVMSATRGVLLIDDDRGWLEVLSEVLHACGLVVRVANDPSTGLALLDCGSAMLVICDYNLPAMDGIELMQRMRDKRANTAVLMVSGEQDPSVARRALAAGALAFLDKGLPPRLFLRELRRWVERVLNGLTSGRFPEPWQRLLPAPPARKLLQDRRRIQAATSFENRFRPGSN